MSLHPREFVSLPREVFSPIKIQPELSSGEFPGCIITYLKPGTSCKYGIMRLNVGDICITEEQLSYICFAGCQEDETSADAYIGERFNGAHTYYLTRCIKYGETFATWQKRLDLYLPSKEFTQHPVLLGNAALMETIAFE